MPRRTTFLLFVTGLVLTLSILPWTLGPGGLSDQVKVQLRDGYGLDVAAVGRTTIAFLPVPRIKFEEVTLTDRSGAVLVDHAQLRGDLRWPGLVLARMELTHLAISNARLDVTIHADATSAWDGVVAMLQERAASGGSNAAHLRRLLINNSRIDLRDARTGLQTTISDVNVVANWPSPRSELDLSGSAIWRGEPIDLTLADVRPDRLAGGGGSPFSFNLHHRYADLSLIGTLRLRGERRIEGQMSAKADSLEALLKWAGQSIAIPGAAGAFSAGGSMALASGLAFDLPAIRMDLGGQRLDGTIAVRRDGTRLSVRATLAGDTLDLTSLVSAPPAMDRSRASAWAHFDAMTSVDLDLRLSASTVKLTDGVQIADVATSILSGHDRMELSLGRATLNGGTLRGRVSLGQSEDSYAAKAQVTFGQIDVGPLLAALDRPRSLTGSATGQIAVDMTGTDLATMLRTLKGRANVTLKGGEIAGLALAEGLRTSEPRAAASAGPSAWRAGRTPFQELRLDVGLRDGIAEIIDGGLKSATLAAEIEGNVSLADETASLRSRIGRASEGSSEGGVRLDISGPWDRLRFQTYAVPLTRSVTLPR